MTGPRQVLNRAKLAHLAPFVLAGGSAFIVDASVLSALLWLGTDPFSARVVAIIVATCASWGINRTWTFPTDRAVSIGEMLRYFGVAGVSTSINYAVYAGVLLTRPATHPLVALVAGVAVATIFSYTGYRHLVFGGARRGPDLT